MFALGQSKKIRCLDNEYTHLQEKENEEGSENILRNLRCDQLEVVTLYCVIPYSTVDKTIINVWFPVIKLQNKCSLGTGDSYNIILYVYFI